MIVSLKKAVTEIFSQLAKRKGKYKLEEVHLTLIARKEGDKLKIIVQPSGYYNEKGEWTAIYPGIRGKFGGIQYEQEIK